MKKGVYVGCFPADMSLEDRFALAREAGFDAIEVRGEEDLISSEERLKALVELSRRTLPISSVMAAVGWRPALSSPDPAERERAVALFEQTIRAASVLGADTVLVVPAVVSDQVTYEQAWERSQAALRRLVPTAERHNVCLGVENVWNKFLLSPLEMRSFVDEVGHPLVQAYFDVGNILAYGYPEQWIRVLGSRIKKVHVKDFKVQQGGNPLGFVHLLEGDVNWPAVVAALREVGYDGPLTAEVPPYRHLSRKGLFDLASSIEAIIGL